MRYLEDQGCPRLLINNLLMHKYYKDACIVLQDRLEATGDTPCAMIGNHTWDNDIHG